MPEFTTFIFSNDEETSCTVCTLGLKPIKCKLFFPFYNPKLSSNIAFIDLGLNVSLRRGPLPSAAQKVIYQAKEQEELKLTSAAERRRRLK